MLFDTATPTHDSDSSQMVASKIMETEVSHLVVVLHRSRHRGSVAAGWLPYLFAPEVASRYGRISASVLALLLFVALATCEEVSSDHGGASSNQTSQLVSSTDVYVTADESTFRSDIRNEQSNIGDAVSATPLVKTPWRLSVNDRIASNGTNDLTTSYSTTSVYLSIPASVSLKVASINVDSTNFADSPVPYSTSTTSVVRSVSSVLGLHATSLPENPSQVLESSMSILDGVFTADVIHGSVADVSTIGTNSEFATVFKINSIADDSTTPTVLQSDGVDPAAETKLPDGATSNAPPKLSVVETLYIQPTGTPKSSVDGTDSHGITRDVTSSISTSNDVHMSTTATSTSDDFAKSHKLRVSTASIRHYSVDPSSRISGDSSLPSAGLNEMTEQSQYDSIYPSREMTSYFDTALSASFIETSHYSRLQHIDVISLPTTLLSTPYLLSSTTIDSYNRQLLATPSSGISPSPTGSYYATSILAQGKDRSADESDYYQDPSSILPQWSEAYLRDHSYILQDADTSLTPSLPMHFTSQIVTHSALDSSRSASGTLEDITTQFDQTPLMSKADTVKSLSVLGMESSATFILPSLTPYSQSLLSDARHGIATTELGETDNTLPYTSTLSEFADGTVQDRPFEIVGTPTRTHSASASHRESVHNLSKTESETTTKRALLVSPFNLQTSVSNELPSMLSTTLDHGRSSSLSVTTYTNSLATSGADVYSTSTYSAGVPSSYTYISGETIIPTATVHLDPSASYTLTTAQSILPTGGEMTYIDTGTLMVLVATANFTSVSSSLDMSRPLEEQVPLTETISHTTESSTFSTSSVMFGDASSSSVTITRIDIESVYDTYVLSTISQVSSYSSPDVAQRPNTVVHSSEISTGVSVTPLDAQSIRSSLPEESITVTHTVINAQSSEQNTESNNQIVLTSNEYHSTILQSSPMLPNSAWMQSLATEYTESELVSFVVTASSEVNPNLRSSHYSVDTTHILGSSAVLFQSSAEVKHSTAISTYEFTTEFITEMISTFAQADTLQPSYSAEHAYATEFIITAADTTVKEISATPIEPNTSTSEEQTTTILRITPTTVASAKVPITTSTETLYSKPEVTMKTQEQTVVTSTPTELAHSEPTATTFVPETTQEMLSPLSATMSPTWTTEQSTITVPVSSEQATTNISVSLILEQMTTTTAETTILEQTATPVIVSSTFEKTTTPFNVPPTSEQEMATIDATRTFEQATTVEVSPTTEQGVTTVVNVSPTIEEAETTVVNVSLTIEQYMTTVVNVSPTIEEAETKFVNVSPTIEEAETTVVKVSPTIERAETTVGNVSHTIEQAETTVVNLSPTIEQAVTTVVNVSPTIEQAVTTVVNVSPTIEKATTTVVNMSPTIEQAETTIDNLSPTLEQATTTVVNVSPTIEQAVTTVVNVSPTIEKATTTVVNVSPTIEQAVTTVVNVSPTIEQPVTTVGNVSPTIEQAVTTVVNVSPTIEKATTTVVNMSPTIEEAETRVFNVSPTIEQETATIDVTRTFEQGTTVEVSPTTEQALTTVVNVSPTIEQAVTTVVNMSHVIEQAVTTVVNVSLTVEQTDTTVRDPLTFEQTTTVVNVPTILEQTTTDNVPTTLEQTTTDNVLTTLEQTTTDNVPTTLEQTTTDNVLTTLEQTTTDNVPTTLEQTTTVNVPTTLEQTTTDNVPTTLEQTTTVNVPTTLEHTTTVNVPTTLEHTTTVNVPTTLEHITTVYVPTTLEQTAAVNVPTNLEQTTTDNVPTTLEQITTTTNVPTTLEQTTTTTNVPTTLKQTTTATNVPTTLEQTTTTTNVPTTLQQTTTTTNVPTTLERTTTTTNVPTTLEQTTTTTNVPTTLQQTTKTTNVPTTLQQTTATTNVPTTLQQTTTTTNVPTTTLEQTTTTTNV